ncbi:MAG: very short patch repair endonuclease [Acidobacteria bacterium]|nr:very short patch repair endonuclease [Acidobacteriota bacterium]
MVDKVSVPRFKRELGFVTNKSRSDLMRKIRCSNTKPERELAKALWKAGFRYRKNLKSLPGRPDIVIRRLKVAIFVDGEFWHGHNWEKKKNQIKSNREFWIPKIERNMERDVEVNNALIKLNYVVIRFWANDVKRNVDACVQKVLESLSEAS